MSTTAKGLMTTPIGTVRFLAHTRPQYNKRKKQNLFSASIEVDKDANGAADFLAKIRNINSDLGSTKGVEQDGNYKVHSNSTNPPKVLDKNGNVMAAEEIPLVESVTARLIVKPFDSKDPDLGGGIGLVAVQLIDYVEYTGGETFDDDAIKAALNS